MIVVFSLAYSWDDDVRIFTEPAVIFSRKISSREEFPCLSGEASFTKCMKLRERMYKLVVWRRLAIFMWFCGAFFSSGPANAAVTFESAFTGTQSFTDNLFFDDQNKESDFGTFFGPNLTLRYDNPDIVIGVNYIGRVALYLKNSGANRYNQNANIILDLPFLTKQNKNLTVTFEESMNLTPQLDAFAFTGAQNSLNTFGREPGPTEQTSQRGSGGTGGEGTQGGGSTQGVYTTRASSFFNRAGVNLGYAWTPRVSGSFQYSNQYLHFFSTGFQDSITHRGTFSLPYGVSEGTTVAPFYTYQQIDYIGVSSAEGTSRDKSISHIPQLQISHNFTPLLSVTIRAGAAFSKQIGVEESVSGGTEQGSDKWQVNNVGSVHILKSYGLGFISLEGSQSIGSGGGLVSSATRTRIFSGRIQHTLSPRLRGFASIGYAQNKSLEGLAIDTDTYQIQAGILYAFRSWLSGNLNYMYINQNSQGGAANSIQVNQIFFGLTAVADPWVLLR